MLGRISSIAGPLSSAKTTWTFRYYRFSITKARDVTTDGSYPTYNIVGITQLSEFELMLMGTKVDLTGATVTNPGGSNPVGQDVSKGVDGNQDTVWLDWSGNGNAGGNATGAVKSWVLKIDFGSGTRKTIDGFRYKTGGDETGRDPVQWVLEGSNDDSTWTVVHRQSTDATITTSRKTYTQIFYTTHNSLPYEPGLFRTTYSGYMGSLTDTNDNVNFFDTATPFSSSIQTTIVQDPSSDDGTDFSRQWLGYFQPSTTETYTFYLNSDDCSWMWIGSNAVSGYTRANATVNNAGLHGLVEKSGTAALTSGTYYPVRIQFGEHTVGDQMDFNYSTPTIAKTTNVTGKVFYHPATKGF
jgi:GLEYA domain